MISKEFRMAVSYDRYDSRICGGYPYPLSDAYFAFLSHDGCLVCTDTQCDLDWDGNICLVTPQLDVLPIGKIPMVEGRYSGEPVSPAKKDVTVDGSGHIHIRYTEYLDNSHHHGSREEMVVDTSLSASRIDEIRRRRFARVLDGGLHRPGILRRGVEANVCLSGSDVTVNGRVRLMPSGRPRWMDYRYFEIPVAFEHNDTRMPELIGRFTYFTEAQWAELINRACAEAAKSVGGKGGKDGK